MVQEVKGRIEYFDSDPFPLKQFDVTKAPFGYLAGSPEIVEQMLQAMGRG